MTVRLAVVIAALFISTPMEPTRERPYYPSRMLAYHQGKFCTAIVDWRGVIVRYEPLPKESGPHDKR